MKKLLALVATALLAVACNDAPAGQQLPAIRFTQPPIRVNVGQIRVDNLTPVNPNAVDAQMPIAPAAAINQWVQDRLVASGGTATLVVSIENASVIETKLPKEGGVSGYFTDQQDAKYDGTMVVRFRIFNGTTMPEAEASVNVTRGRSINEKATVAQREKFYHQLVSDMMGVFNSEADKNIHQFMGSYTSY